MEIFKNYLSSKLAFEIHSLPGLKNITGGKKYITKSILPMLEIILRNKKR